MNTNGMLKSLLLVMALATSVKLKYFKHSSGYPTCFGIEKYQKPPASQAEARYCTISRRYDKYQRYLLKKSIPEI